VEQEVAHQVHPADEGAGHLAIGREDEVVLGQGVGAADLGGLLAQQRGVHGQLALALERRGLEVGPPGQHHQAVQLAEVLLLEPEVRGVDGGRAVVAEDPHRLVGRCPVVG
jgi:hypothetical protein